MNIIHYFDFNMLTFSVAFILIYGVSLLNAMDASEPKLQIFPNQSHIIAPVNVPLGLACEGKTENGVFLGMRWVKNDYGEMADNVRETESMLKLTFSNPSVEDSGVYKCIALYENYVNNLELKVVTVKVDFYEPIRSEDCPGIQKVILGKEGRIKCRVIGNPMPAISWEKDGSPINSERITVQEFGLTIPSVTEDDNGTYTLDAFVRETGKDLVQKIDVNVLGAEICNYNCSGTLSTTIIDMTSQKDCILSLEEMECKIQHKELCLGSDKIIDLPIEYKLLAAYRQICNESMLFHAGSHIVIRHNI